MIGNNVGGEREKDLFRVVTESLSEEESAMGRTVGKALHKCKGTEG